MKFTTITVKNVSHEYQTRRLTVSRLCQSAVNCCQVFSLWAMLRTVCSGLFIKSLFSSLHLFVSFFCTWFCRRICGFNWHFFRFPRLTNWREGRVSWLLHDNGFWFQDGNYYIINKNILTVFIYVFIWDILRESM